MAAKPKTGADRTTRYHQGLVKRGGGRFPSQTLDPAEMEVWEQCLALDDGPEHGKAKRTLMAALHALLSQAERAGAVSKAEVIAWIEENTR